MATTLSFLTQPTNVNTTGRGPLASLQSKGGLSILRYPLDLGSDYKKHYVQFTAKKIQPQAFAETNTQNISPGGILKAGANLVEAGWKSFTLETPTVKGIVKDPLRGSFKM